MEGSESLTGSHPPFDRPVILLDDVVEIAHRPASTTSTQFSGALELTDSYWIGWVPIYVDYSRPRVTR
jgi:hypothetical protein